MCGRGKRRPRLESAGPRETLASRHGHRRWGPAKFQRPPRSRTTQASSSNILASALASTLLAHPRPRLWFLVAPTPMSF
eukprot:scaffold10560_cov133-Isochrysis_galbana.AAC.11